MKARDNDSRPVGTGRKGLGKKKQGTYAFSKTYLRVVEMKFCKLQPGTELKRMRREDCRQFPKQTSTTNLLGTETKAPRAQTYGHSRTPAPGK